MTTLSRDMIGGLLDPDVKQALAGIDPADVDALIGHSIVTVTGQVLDLDLYDELADFRGWLANAQPNLRSGTFRLQFDTEGTNPVPHADLISAYGEMLVVRVYRLRRDPQPVDKLVDTTGPTEVVGNGLEPTD